VERRTAASCSSGASRSAAARRSPCSRWRPLPRPVRALLFAPTRPGLAIPSFSESPFENACFWTPACWGLLSRCGPLTRSVAARL